MVCVVPLKSTKTAIRGCGRHAALTPSALMPHPATCLFGVHGRYGARTLAWTGQATLVADAVARFAPPG